MGSAALIWTPAGASQSICCCLTALHTRSSATGRSCSSCSGQPTSFAASLHCTPSCGTASTAWHNPHSLPQAPEPPSGGGPLARQRATRSSRAERVSGARVLLSSSSFAAAPRYSTALQALGAATSAGAREGEARRREAEPWPFVRSAGAAAPAVPVPGAPPCPRARAPAGRAPAGRAARWSRRPTPARYLGLRNPWLVGVPHVRRRRHGYRPPRPIMRCRSQRTPANACSTPCSRIGGP